VPWEGAISVYFSKEPVISFSCWIWEVDVPKSYLFFPLFLTGSCQWVTTPVWIFCIPVNSTASAPRAMASFFMSACIAWELAYSCSSSVICPITL